MVISEISYTVSPYRRFLIGFSGGLDSTVLLHRFKLWRDQDPDIQLRAVHIHHGLSSNADSLEKQCRTLCSEWNITLIVIPVNIIKGRMGIEAQSRKIRYISFEKILLPGEALITAHHLDDQCETFLLALKRGSGPSGLSSISSRTKFSSTQLLRPFIGETRKSLMEWAKKYSLHWIEDESNQDERYDRNFLRLRIIPLLNKRWPHITTSIARSAALCAEQENLLDELLKKELEKIISKEGALQIKPLAIMSMPHRSALLRRWLLNQGALMPSRSMLNRIWKEVAQSRKDAIPCIHLQGYDIRRFKGLLWRIKSQPSCKDIVLFWRNINEPLTLPRGGKVSLIEGGNIVPPSQKEVVSVRFKVNYRIYIAGRYGRRKLKKIWQEFSIPPWKRGEIPLLFYNEKLIAAAGYFVTVEGWVQNGICFKEEL